MLNPTLFGIYVVKRRYRSMHSKWWRVLTGDAAILSECITRLLRPMVGPFDNMVLTRIDDLSFGREPRVSISPDASEVGTVASNGQSGGSAITQTEG